MAFNNAGIQVQMSDAADEPAENFDCVNAINLRGIWTCTKHELRQMHAQGSGAQLLLAGRPSRVARPGSLPRIPEIMRDQPIARLGRSDEIAAAVFWLCSPGGSFVLGVALRVDAW